MADAGSESNWTRISDLARWTPSPHNTQPFRIRPLDDTRAELLCVCDRLLPEEDHGNLYMAAAFGTFAIGLELAAAHCGLAISVELTPEVEPDQLYRAGATWVLGQARIVGETTPNPSSPIETRRTSRLCYDGNTVGPERIESLHAVATAHGQQLHAYEDKEAVHWVLSNNASAVIDNLQIRHEREEIRSWYRRGTTPGVGDGLWQTPMNQSRWEMVAAFAAPWLVSLPGIRTMVSRRYLRTQAGTRHVGIIGGPFETWPQLYRAGQMLMAFWIEMARQSIYMHPYGSMLTNPRYASAVARRFGVSDAWLIFRFGYSEIPPRSPRLASLLTHE